MDLKFDTNVAKIFKDVGPTLYEIYKVNFPHEISGGIGGQGEGVQMWKQGEKVLFEFLRNYEICPTLLSKSLTFQIYLHTKNSASHIYEESAHDIMRIKN